MTNREEKNEELNVVLRKELSESINIQNLSVKNFRHRNILHIKLSEILNQDQLSNNLGDVLKQNNSSLFERDIYGLYPSEYYFHTSGFKDKYETFLTKYGLTEPAKKPRYAIEFVSDSNKEKYQSLINPITQETAGISMDLEKFKTTASDYPDKIIIEEDKLKKQSSNLNKVLESLTEIFTKK